MATSVLISLIVLLSFYGFQVDGKVDRYAFNIVENGTSFNEQVEVDEENQTEVIRVPQHNDRDAVEIMNDFDAGLSARRLPATKDCYVSKLDSSFPSPAKLKLDMDQASRQSLPDKVTTERIGWRVMGFADRSALPEKILDFCGSFPIFYVEPILLDSMNTTLHRASGHGRRKRTHKKYPVKEWDGCSDKDAKTMNKCLKDFKSDWSKIKLSCKYGKIYCYYMAKCKHQPTNTRFGPNYICTGIRHIYGFTAICCTPSC